MTGGGGRPPSPNGGGGGGPGTWWNQPPGGGGSTGGMRDRWNWPNQPNRGPSRSPSPPGWTTISHASANSSSSSGHSWGG